MAKRHASNPRDLQSLFVRLEELVLANSGEDDFEETFKILVAKMWDERSGKARRFQIQSSDAATARAISELLVEAGKAWPGVLGHEHESNLTPEHLSVCVEALASHDLAGAGLEALDNLFEFLVAKQAKGSKGQYFTPRHVIDFCVRALRPRSDESVLDLASGSGGFLFHALDFVRRTEGLSPKEVQAYCESKLWGFDIDGRAVRVAKALMVMAGDGQSNIIRLNSLLKPGMGGLFAIGAGAICDDGPSMTIEDVCRARLRHHKGFDIILTNPPFAGEVRERAFLDGYTASSGKSRIERDVLFLERCVELLKPGGRMAIVLPHNKLAASAWADVRNWVIDRARVLAVVGLGRHTFLPHTHQKAGVLFLQKRREEQSRKADEEVFFAVSEKDGKDSKGQWDVRPDAASTGALWDRVNHDLGAVLKSFKEHVEI